MMRLSVGERRRRPGWTTLDSSGGADVVAAIPPMPDSVLSVQWDVIELIHVIEHFYLWDARHLLRTFFGMLKVGGDLVLEAPNIEYAAKVMSGTHKVPESKFNQMVMWPLYGDPRHRDKSYGHHWGYTPESLSKELLAAGFTSENIQVMKAKHHVPVRDFRIEATRHA